MSIDEDSDGLRELSAVTVVVEADGRETLLDKEAMLSDALLERRRLNGLRWAKEAIELRRFIELRRESEEGVASLERDLREGILVTFEWLEIMDVEVVSGCAKRVVRLERDLLGALFARSRVYACRKALLRVRC
jgi:hypothetical protein